MLKSFFVSAMIIAAPMAAQAEDIKKAVFAGGGFWGVECNFEHLDGVKEAVSGFAGGTKRNPTYKSFGNHLEAVEVTYDADMVSYAELVDVLLRSSDVIDDGGQFCDRGANYATGIFASGAEAKVAADVIAKHDASGKLPKSIVTPILPKAKFYKVGEYHQDYYKSEKVVLTRRGPLTKAKAYKFYRKGCGRDKRVRQLWGAQAYIPKL